MKNYRRYFLLACFALVFTSASFASGILPGEPDPNKKPGTENIEDNGNRTEGILLDDRKPCPAGFRRFQKMKCGTQKDTPECQNYSPVLECHKTEPKLRCKSPTIPVPVYSCES